MAPPTSESEAVYDDLAEALKALASPARLELLAKLRHPMPLRDLDLAPRRHRPHENPDRTMSTAALHGHLDRLRALHLVTETTPLDGAPQYVVDRARLYALAEVFRDLAVLREGQTMATDDTLVPGRTIAAKPQVGARLSLVHGAYEGRAYALVPERLQDGAWTIGRMSTDTIHLDYDPYVSRVHANIKPVDGLYRLTDSGLSQNGTHINWGRLPRGGSHDLRAGDVVGVGRSLLVFAM